LTPSLQGSPYALIEHGVANLLGSAPTHLVPTNKSGGIHSLGSSLQDLDKSRKVSERDTFHGFHQELDPSNSGLKTEPKPRGSQEFAWQTEIAALAGWEVTEAPAVLHDGQSS